MSDCEKNSQNKDQTTPNADEPDINEELAGLYAEVQTLREQTAEMDALKAKNADFSDQFLRAKAEMENVRRRAEDDVRKARTFSIENFAQDLLAVVDSLDAALAIETATSEQLREGAKVTLKQLLGVFERNKLHVIEPAVGDKFNPDMHQAISMVASEQEKNTVVNALQKGYIIAERVLRPAMVMVSDGSLHQTNGNVDLA